MRRLDFPSRKEIMALTEIQNAAKRAKQNSPYLKELMEQFSYSVSDLKGAQDQSVATLICEIESLSILNIEALMTRLRELKRRAHLTIALLDIAKLWDWRKVTHALTQLADAALQKALDAACHDAGFGESPQGLFAIAVGKYGAFELNYSSDIDFMVFYDPDVIVLPETRKPERLLIGLVQKTVKILDEVNADGYVFRCDLRLRPDPRSNAVMVSTRSAERYYESLGQNWERAAMIKARVCAGDHEAGQAFIDETLRYFIWRRSLDFAAIADIQAMKRQINSSGGHKDIRAAGHHLKLGRGGIREIEFYAQTQQLILGGRQQKLRCIRTDDALAALAEAGFVKPDAAKQLTDDYGFLRTLEHCVQMIDDAQTHICPQDDIARLAVAQLAGYKTLEIFDTDVEACLMRVNAAYTALYPDAGSLASDAGSLAFTGVSPDPETLETLTALGFERAEDVWTLMAGWLGGRIHATRTPRARESLTRLAPSLIKACGDTGLADTAFFRFAEFFERLRAGVTILALFERQPDLMTSCISLMARAPRLAEVLARQPETLDVLIDPDFADFSKPFRDIQLSAGADLEEVMNAVRRHVREQKFRIGAAVLRGAATPSAASLALASLADQAVQTLLPAAMKDVERRLERPGGELAVLAMGKMGGQEMTVSSDLDIMVIYDPGESDPQSAHGYYTKVTQRLISALSAPTQEGELYEVDMALRPSGSAGPITVSLPAFTRYYAGEAWTWEFMALTRGRVCAASTSKFADQLSFEVTKILTSGVNHETLKPDVDDMRKRLERDKGARGEWDIKRAIGGLVDIEFTAQYLQLKYSSEMPEVLQPNTAQTINSLAEKAIISSQDKAALISAHTLYSACLQYLAVSIDGLLVPEAQTRGLKQQLSQYCGFEDFQSFEAAYASAKAKTRALYEKFLG